MTPAQLAETNGVVICPQCLESEKAGTPPRHRTVKSAPDTPPAHRKGSGSKSSADTPPKHKARKEKKNSGPIGTLGCLWRSVLVTMVVLAMYAAIGFLTSSL